MKISHARKFIGDVFDDVGCFFARYDFDRIAAFLSRCADCIDPARVGDSAEWEAMVKEWEEGKSHAG
jgi:hypothetical protein